MVSNLGAQLGDCLEVMHEVLLCHSNAAVPEPNGRIALVRGDMDEIQPSNNLFWIDDGLVSDVFEGCGENGDGLVEKSVLVGMMMLVTC